VGLMRYVSDEEYRQTTRNQAAEARQANQVIKHCAWPTRAPDVCTAFWDQESWDKFGESYRPKGYTGDRYDGQAYQAWRKARRQP